MARGTLIALTTATAGILIAGTAVAVTVVTTSQSSSASETISLVTDATTSAPVDFVPGDLPTINPATVAPAAPVGSPDAPAAAQQGQVRTAPRAGTPSATATSTAPSSAPITSDAARAKVLDQVPGSVVSILDLRHQGYDAFSIKVQAADGRVLVAWVDKGTGVIFDWDVVSTPADDASRGTTASTAPSTSRPSASTSATTRPRESDDRDEHSSAPTRTPSAKATTAPSRSTEGSRDHDDD